MARLGYVKFGLLRFGYMRFLYFLPKSYAFHPRFLFFRNAILWPLTKQRTFYTNGQGSLRISPLNRGSTVLLLHFYIYRSVNASCSQLIIFGPTEMETATWITTWMECAVWVVRAVLWWKWGQRVWWGQESRQARPQLLLPSQRVMASLRVCRCWWRWVTVYRMSGEILKWLLCSQSTLW